MGQEFSLIARLSYLRYPSFFAAALGVAAVEPVELVRAELKVEVEHAVIAGSSSN